MKLKNLAYSEPLSHHRTRQTWSPALERHSVTTAYQIAMPDARMTLHLDVGATGLARARHVCVTVTKDELFTMLTHVMHGDEMEARVAELNQEVADTLKTMLNQRRIGDHIAELRALDKPDDGPAQMEMDL